MRSKLHVYAAVSAVAVSLAIASAARAAEPQQQSGADAASQPSIADIVVTAQRRSQRLQDVPVSVSVVSGDTLTRNGISDVSEMTARLPNVKITSAGNSDLLNIRGVGSGQNPGFEQSVATFVDDVYRGRSRATRAALFDVDHVEVLKGPQTTFFGNNAIAGALNISTRKPGNELAYNVTASSGSYGSYFVEGGISVPLADTFSARVAGRYAYTDGGYYNTFLNKDGPIQKDFIGRASFDFHPEGDFHSTLRFDRGHSRGDNALDAQLLNCPAGSCNPYLAAVYGANFDDKLDKNFASPDTYTKYDFKELAWTNNLDLGDVSINAVTGYFDHRFTQLTQIIPVPQLGVGGGGLLPVWTDEKYRSFSQELRIQSKSGGFLEWMVGAYYLRGVLKTDLYTGFRFPVLVPGVGYLQFGEFDPGVYTADSPIAVHLRAHEVDVTKSAFASATLRPVDHLRVNLGLRYSVVDKTAHREVEFGASEADPSVNFVPGPDGTTALYAAITGSNASDFAQPSRTDKKLMPSVGVQYDLSGDAMAYASYTEGFKAGGYGQSPQADMFGPETVKAYEVGLKSSWFGRRVTADVALFWSDYADLQESTTLFINGNINTIVNNAANARSRGIEGSLNWKVSSNLTLYSEVAYLDAKYRSYPNGSCTIAAQAATTGSDVCQQDLAGQRRAYAPKFSGNVGASLRIPFMNQELRIDPLMYFTSRYFVTPTADPLLEQRANAKFDLRVGVGPEDHSWEFAVVGKNLTNVITSSFRSSAQLGQSTYGVPEPRRTIMVQFSIKH